MKEIGKILWGVALVIVGVILGTNVLGITNIDIFFNGWWTLFIIIPCFIGLFTDNEKTGSIIGLLIGIALLLACNNIIDFEIIWQLFIPILLVVIGLSIIFKDVLNKELKKEIKNISTDNKKTCCVTFSSQTIKIEDEEFKGEDLTAIFGSIKLDLRNAKINDNQVINIYCLFGGIEIYLPEDVKVKVNTTSIFGGVTEKNNSKKKETKKTIYVNGTCIFGGVEVK